MKLSVLQEFIRALAVVPLIVTLELDLSKEGGVLVEIAANVGYIAAAVLPCQSQLLAGLDPQTLAKCPFF
jgi:hypothetical protein